MTTLTDWLLAQIAEDEAVARAMPFDPEWTAHPEETGQPIRAGRARIATCAESVMPHIARHDPARVLAECEAKRRIVELHRSWPVLVERPEAIGETVVDSSDPTALTFRVAKHIAWLTQEEYRKRFGDEPPTAPMLAALAEVYADRPGYDERWRP